jgi:hypothetical protein
VRDAGLVDGDGGGDAVGCGEYHLMRHGRRATHVSGGPHEWGARGPGVVGDDVAIRGDIAAESPGE